MLSGGQSPSYGIAFRLETEDAMRGVIRVADWIDIVHEPIQQAIRRTAEDILKDAASSISRQGPPRSIEGRPPARDTGFLLRSLQIRIGRETRRRGERAYVSSGKPGQERTFKFAFYGFMLESGTARMKRRPFLVPARDRHVSAFINRVRLAVDEAIRQSTS